MADRELYNGEHYSTTPQQLFECERLRGNNFYCEASGEVMGVDDFSLWQVLYGPITQQPLGWIIDAESEAYIEERNRFLDECKGMFGIEIDMEPCSVTDDEWSKEI